MKGDIPAAALRLVSTLPYRTHLSKEPEPTGLTARWKKFTGHSRRLNINGVVYESMSEAARQLGVNVATVKMRYVDNIPYKRAQNP